MRLSQRRRIFLLFLAGYVALALWNWHGSRLRVFGDAVQYYQIAENLVAGNGFSLQDSPPYYPEANRPPVYPLFLAAFLYLAKSPLSVLLIVLAQCAIAAWSLTKVYDTLMVLSEGRDSSMNVLATILLGLSSTFIVLVFRLYTEVLFLAFFALFLNFIVRTFKLPGEFKSRRVLYTAVIGVLLGLMTLTRPIAQLLIVVVVALFMMRKKYPEVLVSVVTFALVISPWIIRNYRAYGTIGLGETSPLDLIFYNIGDEQEMRSYSKYYKVDEDNRNQAAIQRPDTEEQQEKRKLVLGSIRKKLIPLMKKSAVNMVDFFMKRGYNIVTTISGIDSKAFQHLAWKEKAGNFKFLLILAGAAFEIAQRVAFFLLFLGGAIVTFFLQKERDKFNYLAIFLLSYYFIVICAVFVFYEHDLQRLVLPAYFGFVVFLPIMLSGLMRKFKPHTVK
jgi:hypothetical protein